MEDYINREAVLNAVKEWYEKACYPLNHSHYNDGEKAAYEATINEIVSAPAADVSPVRHAKWIPYRPTDLGFSSIFFCSECGQRCDDVVSTTHHYKYCPNCGSHMRD